MLSQRDMWNIYQIFGMYLITQQMFIDYLPWQATVQGTGNTVVNKYVPFTSCWEFRR